METMIVIVFALATGCQSQTLKCGTTTDADIADGTLPPCTTPKRQPETGINIPIERYDDYSDDDKFSIFGGSSTYLFLIVAGVIAVPTTVVLRLCWTRKLQQRQMNAVNTARQAANRRRQNHSDDVFTIDIDNMGYPVIPTYEESMSSPVSGAPPAYDELPPCYADIVKESKKTDDDPQPSTSGDTT